LMNRKKKNPPYVYKNTHTPLFSYSHQQETKKKKVSIKYFVLF